MSVHALGMEFILSLSRVFTCTCTYNGCTRGRTLEKVPSLGLVVHTAKRLAPEKRMSLYILCTCRGLVRKNKTQTPFCPRATAPLKNIAGPCFQALYWVAVFLGCGRMGVGAYVR